ncbi:hypothetical protein [uncultured Ilyobacter sp.]|uniref:hypothetical protein n=1 Tax=uncultured Ilyobacter sp. TaxID=544433 RepID=UPI0029C85FA7|nr:hypothetical protein [uncultured Ilyobacter sp.]
MIKIEKTTETPDSLRGVVYIKNDQSGAYEDEIGEVYVFNIEGEKYDAFIYLTSNHKDAIKIIENKVLDKLSLEEKIKKFILDNYYEAAEIKLSMIVSFLSDKAVITVN